MPAPFQTGENSDYRGETFILSLLQGGYGYCVLSHSNLDGRMGEGFETIEDAGTAAEAWIDQLKDG